MSGPDPRSIGAAFQFGDAARGVSMAEALGDLAAAQEFGAPGTPRQGAPHGSPPGGPWQREQAMDEGVPYRRVPIWPPLANMARSPSVIYMPRKRPVTFGGNGTGAGVLAPQQVPFSQPTIIFARTAAAVDATGTALPVGMTDLHTFGLFMIRTGGDQLDGTTTPIIAAALCGDGKQPALYAANGLFFRAGSTLTITVEMFRANIRADVVLWTIEEYGNPNRPG